MTLLIIGGILAEKIGKKKTISIAIIGALIAALAIVWSNGLWQAAAMTFLLAGCAGILESMGCALISEINPSRSHFLVNLAMGSMAVGYLSAALFSSAFLSLGLNWRMVYAAVILILMLDLLFLRAARLDNKKETVKKLDIHEKRTIWLNKYFILGCICMLLYTGIEVTFFSWLTTYFVLEVKVIHAVSLLIVGFFYLSMVLGRIIYGFLIRRFKAVNIAVLSCFVTAPLIIAVMHAGISGPIYLAIFLLGISFSGISPFIIAATGQIGSRDSSYSAIMGSGGIGTIIIPALVGFTGDLINIRTAISCLAPLMVLIACILLLGIKPICSHNYNRKESEMVK